MTAFNGGKSQVNLALVQTGGDYPFLNALLGAQSWGALNNASTPITPDMLDVNGWPTTFTNAVGVATTGLATVFYVPSQASRPGNYVATWTGNGSISFSNTNTVLPSATFTGSVTSNVLTAGTPASNSIQKGMTLSTGGIVGNQLTGTAGQAGTYAVVNGTNAGSQSITVSGGSKIGSGGFGRYVYSTNAIRVAFQLSALPISNVRVCHVDDEAALNAGEVFQTKFKQRLVEGGFGVIRFLNWQNGNGTNITTWSTRRPATYAYYGGTEPRLSLYGGVTTNVANAYSVAVPSIHSSTGLAWTNGDGPSQGDTVTIVFNASATASGTCSLQVGTGGSSSAINILSAQSNALSFVTNFYPVAGTFQSMATLVYDATLNAWIKQGGCVADGSIGLNNGVPIELMVQLCQEVGAHPYFVTPPLAIDPATDYIPSLAAYCKNYAAANATWMVPRFEGPNEEWNNKFNQFWYASNKATAYHAIDPTHWTANDYHNWYGKAVSVLGQAVNAVYGGTPSTQTAYQVLCGVQTSTGSTASASNARLSSASYVAQTIAPQSGYTKSAAGGLSGWVTHVCCAQYYNSSDTGTGTETTLAAAFAGKAFVASIASGSPDVMTVASLNASSSAAFAVGDTVFGTEVFQVGSGVPAGVTIASFTAGTTPQSITAITNANPAVVSVASPPANGTKVQITGAAAGGMTQLTDGWYTVAGATGSTFQLQSFAGAAINSTTFGTYTSGAMAQSPGNFNLSSSGLTVASQNMTGGADLTAPNTYADACNSGSGSFNLANTAILYGQWKIWAQGFSVNKMCGYEGGFSPDYTGNPVGNSQVDLLKSASKLDSNLSTFTTTNYTNFTGLTGSGFIAEFPSCFQFSGNPNIGGHSADVWAVLEDVYQTPNPPQWAAIVVFNAVIRIFILKT